jgi:hypothetical protein
VGNVRIDKYKTGFRAQSAIAWVFSATEGSNDLGKMWCVGLDANGKVVKGAGVTGIVGVVVLQQAKAIGDVIDVLENGELVDFTLQAGTAAAAGTRYFGVAASGDFSTTNTGTRMGWTVEAGRFIVAVGRGTNPTT